MASIISSSMAAAFGVTLLGALPALAEPNPVGAPFGEAITIGSTVRIDPEGRLQVLAGRYVRVRENPAAAFYVPATGEGAGALIGSYRAKIRPSHEKGVVIPPLKTLAYVELQADGGLCGADDAFLPMACTHADVLGR